MAIRKIVQIGHPALKAKNKPVKSFTSAKTKKLLRDLRDTMGKNNLVGIAAPQIGENYQVFLTEPRKTKYRPAAHADELRVYINPKIISRSKIENIIYEGCGCISGIFGPVKRSKILTIVAFDENRNRFQLKASGLLARVILHEYDHLRGKEFIQKVHDYSKIVNEVYYRKFIKLSKRQVENSTITKLEVKGL